MRPSSTRIAAAYLRNLEVCWNFSEAVFSGRYKFLRVVVGRLLEAIEEAFLRRLPRLVSHQSSVPYPAMWSWIVSLCLSSRFILRFGVNRGHGL